MSMSKSVPFLQFRHGFLSSQVAFDALTGRLHPLQVLVGLDNLLQELTSLLLALNTMLKACRLDKLCLNGLLGPVQPRTKTLIASNLSKTMSLMFVQLDSDWHTLNCCSFLMALANSRLSI